MRANRATSTTGAVALAALLVWFATGSSQPPFHSLPEPLPGEEPVSAFEPGVLPSIAEVTDRRAMVLNMPEAVSALDTAGVELPVRGTPVGHVVGIVHIDGKPAAGHRLSHNLPGRSRSVVIGRDGSFDLGPVDRSSLDLRLANGARWAGTVDIERGRHKHLFIDIHTGSVHGIVVDAVGRPIVGRVAFSANLDPGAGFTAGRLAFDTRTDPKGRFSARGLAPGTYRINISHNGKRGGLPGVNVRPGGTIRDLRIVVEAMQSFRGRLSIPWLNFRKHKTALLSFEGPVEEHALLGRSGQFQVDDLVPGYYRVSLVLAGFETELVKLELVRGVLVGPGTTGGVEISAPEPRVSGLEATLRRFGFSRAASFSR